LRHFCNKACPYPSGFYSSPNLLNKKLKTGHLFIPLAERKEMATSRNRCRVPLSVTASLGSCMHRDLADITCCVAPFQNSRGSRWFAVKPRAVSPENRRKNETTGGRGVGRCGACRSKPAPARRDRDRLEVDDDGLICSVKGLRDAARNPEFLRHSPQLARARIDFPAAKQRVGPTRNATPLVR
jgi:hypothetical protein